MGNLKLLQYKMCAVVLAAGGGLVLAYGAAAAPVQAQVRVFQQCQNPGAPNPGPGAPNSEICTNNDPSVLFGNQGVWGRILNMVTIVLGGVASLMVVIGGFRYVLSSGEGSNTKAAKDTILYSLIGVVLAIVANTIVNFVVSNI